MLPTMMGPNDGTSRLERDNTTGRTKRMLVLDGKPISTQALAGRLRIVLFHPEEMTLIRGPSEGRRRLLNGLMTQSEAGYAAILSQAAEELEAPQDQVAS